MLLSVLTQRFRGWWQPRKGLAIAEACVIGVVAALSAVLLKFGSGYLGTWRVHTSQVLPAWLVLPTIGLCFGFLSGWLVERFAPEASGSGIPQVKASLANIPITLSWRVALVKLVSAMIALGSGITLGRQGPTVQVGAGLAAGLSRWVPTSPDHRRQMIAAGAGAGLAAAFNAPLAGVLFIVEELLQDLSGLTLGTAILASFIGGVISRLLGGGSLQLNTQWTYYSSKFSVSELPFFLLLGILAGLLAALFHRGLITSIIIYRRLHVSLPLRVALAACLSGLIVSMLPDTFRDNNGLREYVITGSANTPLAAIGFVSQFMLTLVAFGSGAPGGLFAPSLILGSTLGYLVGVAEHHILGVGSPTTYALAGMGAFFSGVSKVPITAIVIVFEMTTDFNLVLPLMIGSVTSYLVADKVVPGSLYEKLLLLNGISLKKQLTDGTLTNLTARSVMQERVETVDAEMTLDEAAKVFYGSQHRGFPVMDDGKLVGIVTQSDLLKIREQNLSPDAPITEIMTHQPITVKPTSKLSNVLYLLDRYQIGRLPVVDAHKLLGIISRADIIRAEAHFLNCENESSGPRPAPSYVVYQTQSPSLGQGRILVTVANPETAKTLLEMAAAIARDRHYEIECLQVILASRQSSPSETTVKTTKSRRILRQAEFLGKKWKIPVHTQIRVAHDVGEAILETIKSRNIDIILMGWKGSTSTPNRIFGDVVDTIIRQATCEVMLVKLASHNHSLFSITSSLLPTPHSPLPIPQFNSWLVPMAGGPNAWLAIKLLPALVTLGDNSKIRLTRVFKPSESEPDLSILEKAVRHLIRRRRLSTTVISAPVKANSVAEGVIKLVNTEKYDVVIIGATRESLLKRAFKGNIPETIASGVNSTVILVRGAVSK